MKGTKLLRTFREGIKNFKRNGWLTTATIVVLTFSLFIMSVTMILGITTNLVLESLRDKININVSFNPDVPEENILNIKSVLEKYREVASVEYVSRDKALELFIASKGQDSVIAQALEEIGENPLLASLSIKAQSIDQYDLIAQSLEQASFQEDINRINYKENKVAIGRLESINTMIRKVGFGVGIIFISIALLITFNTIRINMYARKNEFEIMRLVGASNTYVRMPAIFEGIFYGLLASMATIVLLLVSVWGLSTFTQTLFSQSEFVRYALHMLPKVSVVIVIVGVLLGAISGSIAVRKYLKV